MDGEKKQLDNNLENKSPRNFLDLAYKYEVEEILNIKIPWIKVRKLDDNVDIEKTSVFEYFLGYFNKAYNKNLTPETLLYSRSSFDAFMMFLLSCIMKRYLIIEEQCENQFLLGLKKLRKKYNQNLRSIDIYYDIIVEKVFYPKGLTKKDQEVREQMYFFDQAYSLMKVAFKDNKRESGERYFEHIKGVMDIIINELPSPNLNKILIALLHDVQEDLPEYADSVRLIYGNYIADGVNELSKKPRETYLDQKDLEKCGSLLKERDEILGEASKRMIEKYPDKSFMAEKKMKEKDLINYMNESELEKFNKIKDSLKPFEEIAKERRNEDYFGHLDGLNDDYLDVKFADRIHNLRDIHGLTKEKAIRKVEETERYFLDVAKKRNPVAYKLMIEAIEMNKKRFGF